MLTKFTFLFNFLYISIGGPYFGLVDFILITCCFRIVRNYVRKTDRGKWSEKQMSNTISAVLEKNSQYLAARIFPQTTLEKNINLARKTAGLVRNIKVPLGPKATFFP